MVTKFSQKFRFWERKFREIFVFVNENFRFWHDLGTKIFDFSQIWERKKWHKIAQNRGENVGAPIRGKSSKMSKMEQNNENGAKW